MSNLMGDTQLPTIIATIFSFLNENVEYAVLRNYDGLPIKNQSRDIDILIDRNSFSKIKKDFPNALCSEMEASAVGHTCYKFGVPFIITRSLSDVYGHGESSMQFDEYLKIASENSAKLCVELVKA